MFDLSVVDGPFVVTIELGVVAGTIRAIGIQIRGYTTTGASEIVPLTAEKVRRVQFGAILDKAIERMVDYPQFDDDVVVARGGLVERSVTKPSGSKRTTTSSSTKSRGSASVSTEERLRAAAEVYASRVREGSRRPMTETAESFGVSRMTATRWVARAREQGLLQRA